MADVNHPLGLDHAKKRAILTHETLEVCTTKPHLYSLKYNQINTGAKPFYFSHLMHYVLQDLFLQYQTQAQTPHQQTKAIDSSSISQKTSSYHSTYTRSFAKNEPGIWLQTVEGERKPQALLSDLMQDALTPKTASSLDYSDHPEIDTTTLTHTLIHIINPAYPHALHLYLQECLNVLPARRHVHIPHAIASYRGVKAQGISVIIDLTYSHLSWSLINSHLQHIQVLTEFHNLELGVHTLHTDLISFILDLCHLSWSDITMKEQTDLEQLVHALIQYYSPLQSHQVHIDLITLISEKDKQPSEANSNMWQQIIQHYLELSSSTLDDFTQQITYIFEQYIDKLTILLNEYTQHTLQQEALQKAALRNIYFHGLLHHDLIYTLRLNFPSSKVNFCTSQHVLHGALEYALSIHNTQHITIQNENQYDFYVYVLSPSHNTHTSIQELIKSPHLIPQEEAQLLIDAQQALPTQTYLDLTTFKDEGITPPFMIYCQSKTGHLHCILTHTVPHTSLSYVSISYDGIHLDYLGYDLNWNICLADTLHWKFYGDLL